MLNPITAEQNGEFAQELTSRVRRAQERMSEEDISALIVYGNTKVVGGYRYLSGNLDRCGLKPHLPQLRLWSPRGVPS